MYRERIRLLYSQFAPGYRRIADYLLSHYQEVAFMTAAEIGKAAHVDTALVVRFAQRLGYPGFPELLHDVQTEVKQDLRVIYEPPEGDDSPAQVFRGNLLQDRNNLNHMLLHTDLDTVEKTVAALLAAPRILVAGEGAGSHLAEMFAARLMALRLNAQVVPGELAGQAVIAGGLQRADVCVGIGITGMGVGVAVILRTAREVGAYTVAVVDSIAGPVAGAAERVLYAPVQAVGIAPSVTAITAVLNGLAQAAAISRREGGDDRALLAGRFVQTYAEALDRGLAGVRDTVMQHHRPAT